MCSTASLSRITGCMTFIKQRGLLLVLAVLALLWVRRWKRTASFLFQTFEPCFVSQPTMQNLKERRFCFQKCFLFLETCFVSRNGANVIQTVTCIQWFIAHIHNTLSLFTVHQSSMNLPPRAFPHAAILSGLVLSQLPERPIRLSHCDLWFISNSSSNAAFKCCLKPNSSTPRQFFDSIHSMTCCYSPFSLV